MAIAPILSTLPKTARVAYPIIQTGVRRGLSTRAIERAVRAAGLPISRSSILPIRRAILGIEKVGRNLRNVKSAGVINTRRLPESITRIATRYSYTVRIRGRDIQGNVTERYIQVLTDESRLTRGEIESRAVDIINDNTSQYGILEAQATIIEGVQRAPGT